MSKDSNFEALLERNGGRTLGSVADVLSEADAKSLIKPEGKVRGMLDLGNQLLMVASDRISTFDVVHPTLIPYKGIVLAQMTQRWLELLEGIVPNHLITTRIGDFPTPFNQYSQLEGRTMLVEKLDMVPIECVVRGYLSGSGWADYKKTGTVCGIELPRGMQESEQFPNPIFTPATKAASGHDENIPFEHMGGIVGYGLASYLRIISLELYQQAAEYALSRRVIIADTKFEFGVRDGKIVLADEVLTPDSSRFWPLEGYEPGRSQPSFDKQYVRDYAESVGWDKEPPAPLLPKNVVLGTTERYLEAYRMLFATA